MAQDARTRKAREQMMRFGPDYPLVVAVLADLPDSDPLKVVAGGMARQGVAAAEGGSVVERLTAIEQRVAALENKTTP